MSLSLTLFRIESVRDAINGTATRRIRCGQRDRERVGLSIFLLHPCKSGALTRSSHFICAPHDDSQLFVQVSSVMLFLSVDGNLEINLDRTAECFTFIIALSGNLVVNITFHTFWSNRVTCKNLI